MIAFDVQVRTNNKLGAVAQKLVLPVVEIGQRLAVMIRQRVLDGLDPNGKAWSPLGRQRMGTGRGQFGDDTMMLAGVSKELRDTLGSNEKRKWWVRPTEPHPPGFLFKVTSGDFAGWAVYESYDDYLRASPNGDRRDWYKTGEFWRSIGVRPQSASRVKVIATGSRKVGGKRVQNRAIGYYAGRNEDFGVLTYSDTERAFAVDLLQRSVTEQYAIRLQQVQELDRLTSRAQSLNRRTSRLLGG